MVILLALHKVYERLFFFLKNYLLSLEISFFSFWGFGLAICHNPEEGGEYGDSRMEKQTRENRFRSQTP
jgi:hypothetical protein